jgi:hypothetical protein
MQKYLDSQFQDFWDVRRCGNNIGLLIKCPACPWVPPSQNAGEDFVWYGYRKWRALANHMVVEHCRAKALSFRHRTAIREGTAKLKETKFAGKRSTAA